MRIVLILIPILPVCVSFNFLICIPNAIESLHGLVANIAYESAKNGHNVTFISAYKLGTNYSNIHELTYPKIGALWDSVTMFDLRSIKRFQEILTKITIDGVYIFWSDERTMALWEERNQFDIFMTFSYYSQLSFPFLMNFTGHFVQVCSPGVEMMSLSREGNWLTPAVVPSIILNFDDHLTFWERIQNLPGSFLVNWVEQSVVRSSLQYIYEVFPDFGDPFDYYDRIAMTFINGHFAMDGPVPLLPSQIEIGTINARRPQPLPEDLESFFQSSGDAGVIYFSLGSLTKSSAIPKDRKEMFVEAFRLIPQRVLWKYEGKDVEVSEKLKIQKWMPQQDILGHSKIRLFISHCGNLGTQEAKYHGVPVLGVPIAFDQPRNAARMVRKEYALVLQWEELTSDKIVEAINILINDTSYKERLKTVSRVLQDQKDDPAERAVWWLEYLVRHNGAPHLQYAGKRLSLFQYVMLDVILFWSVVLLVIIFLFIYIIKAMCCSSKQHKVHTKKKKQ